MKIYSKFVDFYDFSVTYFSNDNKHYIRKTSEISFTNDFSNPIKCPLELDIQKRLSNIYNSIPHIEVESTNFKWGNRRSSDYFFALGFCGKIYLFIFAYKFSKYVKNNRYFIFNDIEKYKLFRKNNNKAKMSSIRMRRDNNIISDRFNDNKVFTLFNDAFHDKPFLDNIFISLNTPIFIITNKKHISYAPSVIINPNLKDYLIQKKFNPINTYQEVDMYLSNILTCSENNDINMTDELKRDLKGFDECSFKSCRRKKC
jgi:hypothetical protein